MQTHRMTMTWDELNTSLAMIGGIEGLLMMGPGMLGIAEEHVAEIAALAKARMPVEIVAILGDPSAPTHRLYVQITG